MSKSSSTGSKTLQHLSKKTSTSGKPSMLKRASMNKCKKRNYKVYRGQGR